MNTYRVSYTFSDEAEAVYEYDVKGDSLWSVLQREGEELSLIYSNVVTLVTVKLLKGK